MASENDGPASLVNVDSGQVTPLHQLDVPARPSQGFLSLTAWPGGALGIVTHQSCAHCALTQDDFLISPSGAVRHLVTHYFAPFDGTIETTPIPGSTAEWVLRRPRRGACTLRLLPSARAGVTVPCGDLGQINANAITLWTRQDQVGVLVNPQTGAVLSHPSATVQTDPIGHGLAIESGDSGPYLIGPLSLVNLATGKHRLLGWPSRQHNGFQLYPDPSGPYVAIEFGDPAYPQYSNPTYHGSTIGQAADLWLLNTQTSKLTHVPGFPILESLKQSGIAWTGDGRLVIAATGGSFHQSTTRTAIAVWRPGQRALHVGSLPPLNGYTSLIPLTG